MQQTTTHKPLIDVSPGLRNLMRPCAMWRHFLFAVDPLKQVSCQTLPAVQSAESEDCVGGSCTSAHRRLRYELLGGSDILVLVDLLHLGGLVGRTLDFLKRGQVVVIAQALIVIVDAQAELDHAVDAASELGGLVEVEA